MLETRENKSFFYKFGEYRLSPAERQLSRGTRPITLTVELARGRLRIEGDVTGSLLAELVQALSTR